MPSTPSQTSRRIGDSVLPSSNWHILTPIDCAFGQLQVRELPEEDTHALFLLTGNGEARLASHPNGFSCHALAKRMAAGSFDAVKEQVEYIVACGGTTEGMRSILAAMGRCGKAI